MQGHPLLNMSITTCKYMRKELRLRAFYWGGRFVCVRNLCGTVGNDTTRKFSHEGLSTQDITKYKSLYYHIDKERDGIKVCDFLKIVRELGLTATEQEIEHVFKGLHLKSYGVMTEKEFISFFSQIKATSLRKLEVEMHDSKNKKGVQEHSQSWWSRKLLSMKAELIHYRRGFLLLYEQLKFASKRTLNIVEGRPLSRYESRKVFRAAKDFLLLIPVAGAAMLPGGTLLVALLVRHFPQVLPSTFHLENMSHQRKNEVVMTEVTACLEEMERKLNKEKVEWIESDATFSRLLEFVLSGKCDSMSLEEFLHNEDFHCVESARLKTNGIIDRLDSTWLLLLCQSFMSTAGSGTHDPKNIAKSPRPILRSLFRRHLKHIAKNNKAINSDPEKVLLEAELLLLASQSDTETGTLTLSKVLNARGFPPTLSLADTRVWMQLEDNFLVLLSYLFHLRGEYLISVGGNCSSESASKSKQTY